MGVEVEIGAAGMYAWHVNADVNADVGAAVGVSVGADVDVDEDAAVNIGAAATGINADVASLALSSPASLRSLSRRSWRKN